MFELKVPPPVVMVLTATAMGLLAMATPRLAWPLLPRMLAGLAIALAGGAVAAAGARAFRRAATTVNPLKPHKASSLVTTGVYRFTRNPMYLGLLCVLAGWTVFLAAPLALAGPVAFVLYIGRFQIAPEERVLSSLFGADYAAYRARVRRWL